ncbi:U-box domain-containing protein [Quillaja saponaria]|uniref:U-box domain-containing protein n=1 Tax=Quillaja saponaria TaxID=32244 RepID=A0AAD7KWF8_QUISA|nr:U-box domain-containing protein [Quillaja saponaria]
MSNSSSSSSSTSIWVLSYIKLKFFTSIKRFVQSKSTGKQFGPSDIHFDGFDIARISSRDINNNEKVLEFGHGMKEEIIVEDEAVILQRSVKKLHFGSWEEKELAAQEIQRLAKEDIKVRKFMTELGIVPVLVSMAASEVTGRRRAAVKALIELANGAYTNKALMVEAGILSKLPKKIDLVNESTRSEFAELVLSLSSLADTQFPLDSSEFLPFLTGILVSSSSYETKESCLGALYNLSTVLENARPLVSNGLVDILLEMSSIKKFSERALVTLGNLVVTLMGKKAMENSGLMPENLIEILSWDDKPKCQELSVYILMILAHQSSAQREKMAQSGIVTVLLGVALLGSPLAQRRSLKLLQWFKDERQRKMEPHSGPQTSRIAMVSAVNQREAQAGKRMMKSLVKQSLQKNMQIISQRANAGEDSSKLKALVISTSSKSLPY